VAEKFEKMHANGNIWITTIAAAILVRNTLPTTQRQWVGLTEQDMPSGEDPMFDHQYFIAGLVYADKVLKEKNSG
jgi:hypothetical protein